MLSSRLSLCAALSSALKLALLLGSISGVLPLYHSYQDKYSCHPLSLPKRSPIKPPTYKHSPYLGSVGLIHKIGLALSQSISLFSASISASIKFSSYRFRASIIFSEESNDDCSSFSDNEFEPYSSIILIFSDEDILLSVSYVESDPISVESSTSLSNADNSLSLVSRLFPSEKFSSVLSDSDSNISPSDASGSSNSSSFTSNPCSGVTSSAWIISGLNISSSDSSMDVSFGNSTT